MDGHRLAIVIPAYRERETLPTVVVEAIAHGTVLVIDDCSPDDTSERARAAGATVVRNETNLGYDGTLSRGFDEAAERGFSHVVTMDADGEHDPAHLEQFRRLLLVEGVPLVLGYRPHKQRFAEVLMGLYVRARYGVRDILCGMKGYDLALYRANGGFDHSGSIGTELAINSLRRNVPFAQLLVTGRLRSDSPRFDRRLQANLRIFAALVRAFRRDVAAAHNKPVG